MERPKREKAVVTASETGMFPLASQYVCLLGIAPAASRVPGMIDRLVFRSEVAGRCRADLRKRP